MQTTPTCTDIIAFNSAGSAGIIAAQCRYSIPPSNRWTVALKIPRTVQVSHKCSDISSLLLCNFPMFCHLSKFFSVSVLLREINVRFLLHPLVATLHCLIRSLFCHFFTWSVYMSVVSNLSFFASVWLHFSVPTFQYFSVCLFSRPRNYQIFSSLTFLDFCYSCLPFIVHSLFRPFAYTFLKLNDALFHRILTTLSLYTLVALFFTSPFFQRSVSPFLPQCGTPSLYFPVLLLFCFIVTLFIYCLSFSSFCVSVFQIPWLEIHFVHLLQPLLFFSFIKFLRFFIFRSIVPPFLYEFASPIFHICISSPLRFLPFSSLHLISQ